MASIRRSFELRPALLICLALSAGFGCSAPDSQMEPAVHAVPAPAPEPAPDMPGAFDTLKLVRFSRQVGPVYFAHDLHAELLDRRGAPIACGRCHHRLKEEPALPPLACSSCHLPEDQAREAGMPPNT